MVIAGFLLGFCEVVFYGLKHTLYILILRLVELLDLASLVGIFVEFDGTASISLARGVGCDVAELVLVLEGGGQLVGVIFTGISGRALIFEVLHSMGCVSGYWIVGFRWRGYRLESCSCTRFCRGVCLKWRVILRPCL